MSARTLLDSLAKFKGKRLNDVIDEINEIATKMKYVVNVMDPDFNVTAIDNERNRLNIRTDKDAAITSFTIG